MWESILKTIVFLISASFNVVICNIKKYIGAIRKNIEDNNSTKNFERRLWFLLYI